MLVESAATGSPAAGKNARMPRVKAGGPVGLALGVWELWRRLPRKQRRWVFKQARKHGPRLAKQVYTAQRARKRR